MNGRYATLLKDFAAQPHSPAGDTIRAASQQFDVASTSWRQVSQDPGWKGVSAVAASSQFVAYSQRIDINREQLLRAARNVEAFNSLIDSARDAYETLPPSIIDQSEIDRLVAGASILVQGIGPIFSAQDLMSALQTLASNREVVAESAVLRIRAAVEELRSDTVAATSAMVVSHPVSAAEANSGGRPSLDKILKAYQVRDDPNGWISWQPSGLNRWLAERLGMLPEPQGMTFTEGALLDRLGPVANKSFKDAYDQAFDTASRRFPSPDGLAGNDNHTDAFRHAYWNAILARNIGHDWARDFTTAHEGISGNPGPREAMDLYNNEVGRQIASEHPFASEEQIADHIHQAVKDGRLVVIAPDGKSLEWSDRVPIGGAGTVEETVKPLPGKDPKDLVVRSAS